MICAKLKESFWKQLVAIVTAVGCNAQIRRKNIVKDSAFADNGKSFKAMLSGKILNPIELGKRVGKKF